MKKRYILLLIAASLLSWVPFFYAFLPKNVPLIAHFANRNSIKVTTHDELNIEQISIKLAVMRSGQEPKTVFEGGTKHVILKDYGENDWYLRYGNKTAYFRHFKTNNWHDHHYSFIFFKEFERIKCAVNIEGPDAFSATVELSEVMD